MPINRRNRKFPGEVDPPPTEDETVFTEVSSTSRSEVDPILQTEETEGHEDIEPPSHSVEKVRKKFNLKKSRLETRPFWTWSEVKEGMMVYLKYYGFWHAVLVTQVIENLSKIRGIHYAVGRTIFHSRVVKEDDFVVNLDRNELWEARIPEVVRRPIPETIELAHGLIASPLVENYMARRRDRRNRKFNEATSIPTSADEKTFTKMDWKGRSEVDPILQTWETESQEPSPSVESVEENRWFNRNKLKTRPIWKWSDIEIGMMVYLKYYGFWHAVLVTQVIENLSKIRGIHYAVGRTIFHSRVVKEDDFVVNLNREELWEVRIPEAVKRPIPETIELA